MESFEHLNYYELLGIERTASADDIKRAFRQQVGRYHPDHYSLATPDEQEYASKRMRLINEAYQTLSESRLRKEYDVTLPLQHGWQWERTPQQEKQQQRTATEERHDYQADLYRQACVAMDNGNHTLAVTVLQELQNINPFYRDSAALLATAKNNVQSSQGQSGFARSHSATVAPTPSPSPSPSPSPHTKKPLFGIRSLLGGLGAIVVIGVATMVFIVPQFHVQSVRGVESPATATSGATSVVPSPDAAATTLPTPPPSTIKTVAPTALTFAAHPLSTTPSQPSQTATTLPNEYVAEQGTLLVRYDFTDPTLWANMEDTTWMVGTIDGAYHITSDPGIGNIWSYNSVPSSTNYSIGVDTHIASGSAGMVIDFLDSSNYIAFFIVPTTQHYWIEQYTQGSRQVLADGNSQLIDDVERALNRLAIRIEGNTLRAFINDAPIAIATLTTMTNTNMYGLVAASGEEPADAIFDNVEIRAIP